MFVKSISPLFISFFLATFCLNVYSSENFQKEIFLDDYIEEFQSNTILENTPQRHYPTRIYDIYSSDEKKFAFFRVFKGASGTLTHFLSQQVPDLTSFRAESVPKRFKEYFKFAFVRNPWDRIVSCYFHKVVTGEVEAFADCFGKDFEYFVNYINKLDVTIADRHIRLQTRLIPVKHCDFIGKIDDFVNDLQYICDVLGLEMSNLSHRHKSEHAHYSTYYTPRTRKIIAEKYKEDIETFQFKFETK